MVRFIRSGIFVAALLLTVGLQRGATQQQAAPKDQMFSGTVTAITPTSLTATRTGSKDSKTFAITPETKFEGPKPQVDSRVTIRFISAESGDRAVRVIVRSPANKK